MAYCSWAARSTSIFHCFFTSIWCGIRRTVQKSKWDIDLLPIGQSTCNVNGLWNILAVIVPSTALDVNCEPERNLRKCCYKDIQICCKNSRRLGTRKLSTMTQVLNYKASSYQIKESITHLMPHTFTILVPLILFALKRERKRSFFLSFFLFFFDQELRWGEACPPPFALCQVFPSDGLLMVSIRGFNRLGSNLLCKQP